MTLEFEEAIKVLEEHIEILKQNLLFLMAEHKPENITQIITVKRELDKAVWEKRREVRSIVVLLFFLLILLNLHNIHVSIRMTRHEITTTTTRPSASTN
jgi:preprotein translocase subunit SecE